MLLRTRGFFGEERALSDEGQFPQEIVHLLCSWHFLPSTRVSSGTALFACALFGSVSPNEIGADVLIELSINDLTESSRSSRRHMCVARHLAARFVFIPKRFPRCLPSNG